ncbi:MGA_1079 family surface serine endopeptidase [Mycoplasma sp. 5912]
MKFKKWFTTMLLSTVTLTTVSCGQFKESLKTNTPNDPEDPNTTDNTTPEQPNKDLQMQNFININLNNIKSNSYNKLMSNVRNWLINQDLSDEEVVSKSKLLNNLVLQLNEFDSNKQNYEEWASLLTETKSFLNNGFSDIDLFLNQLKQKINNIQNIVLDDKGPEYRSNIKDIFENNSSMLNQVNPIFDKLKLFLLNKNNYVPHLNSINHNFYDNLRYITQLYNQIITQTYENTANAIYSFDNELESEIKSLDKYLNQGEFENFFDLKTTDNLLEKIKSIRKLQTGKVEFFSLQENSYKSYLHKVNALNDSDEVINSSVFEFFYNNRYTFYIKFRNDPNNEFLTEAKTLNDKINFIKTMQDQYFKNSQNTLLQKINDDIDLFITSIPGYNEFEKLDNDLDAQTDKLKKYITDKDLIPSELKDRIKELKEKITNDKYIDDFQRDELLNELSQVITLNQFTKVRNKIKQNDKNIEDDKKALLTQISKIQAPQSFYNYNATKIYFLSDATSYDNYKNNLWNFITSFNSAKDAYQAYKNKRDKKQIDTNALWDFLHSDITLNANKIYNFITDKFQDFDYTNIQESINTLNKFKQLIDQTLRTAGVFNQNDFDSKLNTQAQGNDHIELSDDAKRYELNNYLYSASINKNNAKFYLNNFNTEFLDYQPVSFELKNNDKNTLIIHLKAFLKNDPSFFTTIDKEITFSKDVNPIINEITLNNLDQFYQVDYFNLKKLTLQQWQNLSLQDKKKYFKPKTSGVGKFFKFDISQFIKYENSKLYFKFDVLFDRQIIKTSELSTDSTILFSQNPSNSDAINLQAMLDLLNKKDGNVTFYNLLKIKDGRNWGHSQYLASEAKKAFDESYDLPKFGRYQMIVKSSKVKNLRKGEALLQFSYSIDGVEANVSNEQLKNWEREFPYFKLLDFEDILPKSGNNMTDSDFTGYTSIDANHQAIIDKLNETNFSIRKNDGKHTNGPKFNLFDAKDFIAANVFKKANYFINISNGVDNKATNLDDQLYVPYQTNINPTDNPVNPLDNEQRKTLILNYFIYFYDFKLEGKRGLKFKLGFINKFDSNKRYSNFKEYHLINLVNDYKQVHYPNIILNNIQHSNLQINQKEIAKNSAKYFANHLDQLNEYIKVTSNRDDHNFLYNNYLFPENQYKIVAIGGYKNDTAYIKLGYTNIDNQLVTANVWYKITGFKNTSDVESLDKLTFGSDKLQEIYHQPNQIERTRVIEPYWQDAIWNYDANSKIAGWILKRKYLEKTLLNPQNKNNQVLTHIYGGILAKNTSISGFDINFDLNKLIDAKRLNFRYDFNHSEYTVKINVQVHWDAKQGVIYQIWTDNNTDIVVDQNRDIKFDENSNFNPKQPFIINNYGARVKIKYTSDSASEDFGQITNEFDYTNTELSSYSTPLVIYTKPQYLFDTDTYNPNINVVYKLHDGYKMNFDYIRTKKYINDPLINNTIFRSFLYTANGAKHIGSASMLAKVNDDPNDGRFYFATNWHVERVNNFAEFSGENLPRRINSPYLIIPIWQPVPGWQNGYRSGQFDNYSNVTVGYRYSRNTPNYSVGSQPIDFIWSGVNQIQNDGKQKPGDFFDESIMILDINPIIQQARRLGQIDKVIFFEKWFKIPSAKFDFKWQYTTAPYDMQFDTAMMGWPGQKEFGYLMHRITRSTDTNQFDVAMQTNFLPLLSESGHSGAGNYLAGDIMMGLLNAGGGFDFTRHQYLDAYNLNYMGINWNRQNPLALPNTHSFASQIFRLNSINPDKYAIPWFLKEIK